MWSRPESYFNELRRPAMRTPEWHWALRTIPLCLPSSVWRDWARTWRKQEPGTKRPRVLAQRKQHGGWPFLLIVSFAPAQWWRRSAGVAVEVPVSAHGPRASALRRGAIGRRWRDYLHCRPHGFNMRADHVGGVARRSRRVSVDVRARALWGLTRNLRKPRNTAKCLPTPALHFCYPGATGLRFRPGRQPAVEPAAPLSRHNPHDARSSGSGLGAAPWSKFALQRQPSVRQAALEQLPTPMPFTTGSFRACASGSRTANNGVHQLSLRARKIVLSLLNASRPNRVPIEKADTFASCAGDHCRHLIT